MSITVGMPGSTAHIAGNKDLSRKDKATICLKMGAQTLKDVAVLTTCTAAAAGATGLAAKKSPAIATKFANIGNGIKETAGKILSKEAIENIKDRDLVKKFNSLPGYAKAAAGVGAAVLAAGAVIARINNGAKASYLEGETVGRNQTVKLA